MSKVPKTPDPFDLTDLAKITIKQVNWIGGDAGNTAYKGWVSVNGYSFKNYISVTGTNLQDVEFTQYFKNATTGTDFAGNPIVVSPNDIMANTPAWTIDGQRDKITGKIIPARYAPLEPLNDNNTFAVTPTDTHSTGPYLYMESDQIKYCEETMNKADFKIEFVKIDPSKSGPANQVEVNGNVDVIDTYTWGYQWSNYSYKVTQGLPVGDSVGASPQTIGGAGLGMLTGYGDGVNFSRVELK